MNLWASLFLVRGSSPEYGKSGRRPHHQNRIGKCAGCGAARRTLCGRQNRSDRAHPGTSCRPVRHECDCQRGSRDQFGPNKNSQFVPNKNTWLFEAEPLRTQLGRVPAGRMDTPQEVAKLVAWLSSEDASLINGQAVVADGGLWARTLMKLGAARETSQGSPYAAVNGTEDDEIVGEMSSSQLNEQRYNVDRSWHSHGDDEGYHDECLATATHCRKQPVPSQDRRAWRCPITRPGCSTALIARAGPLLG